MSKSVADHAQLVEKQMKRDNDKNSAFEVERPVNTGENDSKLAAKQIDQTFELSKKFIVGCEKPD